jgi:hypothetical protein
MPRPLAVVLLGLMAAWVVPAATGAGELRLTEDTFSFELRPGAPLTSAGVYDAAGKLVCQLWATKLPTVCVGMDAIPGGRGVMLVYFEKAHIYHYTPDGLLIGQMEPGEPAGKVTGWMDNTSAVAVHRDSRDGLLDVFGEDSWLNRNIRYRVDERDIETVTIEGTTDPKNKGKQLHYMDFHPTRKNIRKDGLLVLTAGSGEITFPVETPGDMTRIRIGVYYRARDPRDAWDVAVSIDDGKTFKSVGRCEGPTRNHGKYFVFADVPPGTRNAQVRFSGTQRNTTMIYQTRIDADYREPRGGFRPVKVTYVWDENGEEKQHVHVARSPKDTYTITCSARPTMKSLVLELAD